MTIVWPGTPGDTFTNNTNQILYQLHCAWHNTCGTCAQYDLAIAEWWGLFHHGCNCVSTPVYPGNTGAVYHDWQQTIADLPESQQRELVGASNWRLLEEGVVDWGDVVTQTRVRTLEEVVSRENLTVDQMIEAGVRQGTAERAWASVNTPEHILAQAQQADLVQQIQELGITPQTLAEMFGDQMAQRIMIVEGPSGLQSLPPLHDDADWVRILMASFAPSVQVDAQLWTSTQSLIVNEVGSDAAQSPSAFVAAVEAGLAQGRTYSSQIISLYDRLRVQ